VAGHHAVGTKGRRWRFGVRKGRELRSGAGFRRFLIPDT